MNGNLERLLTPCIFFLHFEQHCYSYSCFSLALQQVLSIVVVGASGDLAKKKTYPSLLNLYEENLLPKEVVIYGYARSSKTHEQLREHLYPHLIKTGACEHIVRSFLEKCFYFSGKT